MLFSRLSRVRGKWREPGLCKTGIRDGKQKAVKSTTSNDGEDGLTPCRMARRETSGGGTKGVYGRVVGTRSKNGEDSHI